MRRMMNNLKVLVLFIALFVSIPVVSHADMIMPPSQPVLDIGPIIVVILIIAVILVGISVFVLKESKREKAKKVLKNVVITGAYTMMFWQVCVIAEKMVVYAVYNGYFDLINGYSIVCFFVLTAILIISLIFRIQKKNKLANIFLITGWIPIIVVYFWTVADYIDYYI